MKANNPLTDPIEQPKKSASLMGLPTPAPIYRNLVVVHYHLRPGGVRRIIELALRHIALATPNPLAAIVLATGEKPEPTWREILTRSLPGTPVHFFWEPAFRYLSEQRSSHEVIRGKVQFGSRQVGANLLTRRDTLLGAKSGSRAQFDSFR